MKTGRPTDCKKDERITIRLDYKTLKNVEKRAFRADRSKAEEIRELITWAIDHIDEQI